MSGFLVLSTPLGFYIFSDPQMILVESNFDSDPNILKTLQKKATFIFPNSLFAAKIIHSIEHEYTLPDELFEFFSRFTKLNITRAVSAKWYFISEILCQLVTDKFKFTCICIPARNQRLLYTFLPELIETNQEDIDNASREVSLAMCSDEFHIFNEVIDNNEEENQNEPKPYIQDFIFLDSD